jgi:hypothetical protein
MNYQQIHNNIIYRAKTRTLTGYKERHHIIPKCIGGTDDQENLVDLTAKEHFIIHKLLCKLYPDNDKLLYAYYSMTHQRNQYRQQAYRISTREYQYLKEQHAIRMSTLYKGRYQKPTRSGHKNTPEHNKKIANAISALGPKSNETKDKISNSLQGNIPWNKGKVEKRVICSICNRDYAIKYKKKHKCFNLEK